MPRKPSATPSWHKASQQYCCFVCRETKYLGKDLEAATIQMRQMLLAAAQKQPNKPVVTQSEVHGMALAELFVMYIQDVEGKRKANTIRSVRERLVRATKTIDPETPVGQIRKFHLSTLESAMMKEEYSPTTVKDTLAAVMQVFRWAAAADLVDGNRLAGYKLPAGVGRTRVVTQEEFYELLRAASRNPSFRRILIASKFAGCRPGELRVLTWEMVDLDAGLWILPTSKHKTGTTQREPKPRIIPLPEIIIRMCRSLKARATTEHVFVNERGEPYTKNCLVLAFDRARKRAGIKPVSGENLVLYSNRHTFGTEGCGKVSDIELAEVMGHTTTRTLRRYVHLKKGRLKEIRDRIG